MNPLLFLDFDDVICLNRPYGGYDVAVGDGPADLWERLWHRPAIELLQGVVTAMRPRVVLTTSWLRFLQLDAAKDLFDRTGIDWLGQALHPQGEALQMSGRTRLEAINDWLRIHHRGEPYAIVDDHLSGTGLKGSSHDKAGRVILCEVNMGLQPHHIDRLYQALGATTNPSPPPHTKG